MTNVKCVEHSLFAHRAQWISVPTQAIHLACIVGITIAAFARIPVQYMKVKCEVKCNHSIVTKGQAGPTCERVANALVSDGTDEQPFYACNGHATLALRILRENRPTVSFPSNVESLEVPKGTAYVLWFSNKQGK